MDNQGWLDSLQGGVFQVLDRVLLYLPQMVAALLVLIVGWLLAVILRKLTLHFVRGLGWVLPHVLAGSSGKSLRQLMQSDLLGGIVFWVVILITVASATSVLGLEIFSSWLETVLNLLPLILLAALVILSSVVVSQLVREAVNRASSAAGLEYSALLGYAVQSIILMAAAVIALDLLGFDITFLVMLAAILLGAVSGGAALAFGLGAQDFVSNMLGIRSLRGRFQVGDSIHIGEVEGQVVEMDRRVIILETSDGLVSVPGSYFNRYPCKVLIRESVDG